MIARVAAAAIAVSLLTATARAQSTADGVSALLGGDVGRAAAILQPIAEDWRHPDSAATFFLGTLYETGRGVPLDPLRACALYLMTSRDDRGPFGQAAMRLTRLSILSHQAQSWNADCTAIANAGLANRFEPAAFTLGDQSVEWSIGGATVAYQQRERWFPNGLLIRGAVFLPLKQTDLIVPAAGAAPLHFVQLAFFELANGGWQLRWFLYEIVRGEVRLVTTDGPGARYDGAGPPDVTRFDLGTVVDLHVSASGVLECTMQTPAGPRAVAITLSRR